MTTRSFHRLAARILLVTFTTLSVGAGSAFGQAPPSPAPVVVPDSTLPSPATLPVQPPEPLTKAELRELVAPIALYPDVVLASMLPATTNPEQLHEAAQFVGTAARVERIPEDRGWDGSIIGLLQFPDVLRWLDQNPAWTDQMGQAVTYQQGDVLQAIQDFRRAAKDAGNLQSNQYQRVRAEPNRDIRIEPARPDVVYVPSYDPVAATQPQPAAASTGINPWLAFGGGVAVGALGAWALYSIFDDDDDHDHHDNYYGGRRIRSYNNYYYSGRRRPQAVEWTPRQRAYRGRQQGWQQTRRLEHTKPAAGSARSAALRPPTKGPGTESLRPREQRQEKRQQRQESRQGRHLERREQRQQRQELHREQRQEKQLGRQQKRQGRQEQRQKHQTQGQEKRQEQRVERREQRTKRQEQRKTQRQERQQKKQNAKKKDNQ